MEQTLTLEVTDSAEQVTTAATATENSLSIMVVYQDSVTHGWAMQKCRRAMQLVGREYVHCRWWQLDLLSHPQVLQEAIMDAAQADILIVAVYATAQVPPALSEWCEGILAHRNHQEGALVALLGLPEQANSRHCELADYLKTSAAKAGLDFLPQEFKVPAGSATFFMQEMAQRATTVTPLLSEILNYEHSSRPPRWGLNE